MPESAFDAERALLDAMDARIKRLEAQPVKSRVRWVVR